jgi:hypothetical protein
MLQAIRKIRQRFGATLKKLQVRLIEWEINSLLEDADTIRYSVPLSAGSFFKVAKLEKQIASLMHRRTDLVQQLKGAQ